MLVLVSFCNYFIIYFYIFFFNNNIFIYCYNVPVDVPIDLWIGLCCGVVMGGVLTVKCDVVGAWARCVSVSSL